MCRRYVYYGLEIVFHLEGEFSHDMNQTKCEKS
jgi:hypothetical protein